MAEKSMKDKAVNGVFWTAVNRYVNQILQFCIGICLARLLAPEDYGIVGMTSIFFAISYTLIDSGIGSALIQRKNRTEADYCTCFYFNIFMGAIIAAILFICAPLIAAFYNMPVLESVTRVMSVCMFFGTLSGVPKTMMRIDLRFKEMAIIDISTRIVTGLCGLYLAYCGWGVWALVFQGVAGTIFSYIILQYYCRWWPKEGFSKESFKHLFGFGSRHLCSCIINDIYSNIYTLVIGKKFSASDVAYYTRSEGYANLPGGSLLGIILNVAYPLMAEVQDDVERLRKTYQKFLRLPCFVIYPILVGLASLANPLIVFMISDRWLPCVPLLQILCIGAMFDPLTYINLNILYVKGRTDLVLKLELIKKPIAFVILFGFIPFGIWWMCFGKIIYSIIAYSFNCYYTGKFINYGFWKQIYYNVPVIAKSAFMGLVSWYSTLFFESAGVKLLVGIPVGIVTYVGLAMLTRDESWIDLLDILKSKFLKRK